MSKESPICILGAFRQEIAGVKRLMAVESRKKLGPADCWQGSWQGKPIVLVRTGMGKARAADALLAVLEFCAPTVILSIGYAGGIASGLERGDLFLADRVIEAGKDSDDGEPSSEEFLTDTTLANRTARLQPPPDVALHRGALLTVSEVASQPEKKRALQERFAAQTVDMETSALIRLAAEKNIPFLSLRAISDSVTDELMDVSPMLEPDGKVSPLKAGWYVVTHPGSLKNLLSLKDIAKKATDNLTQFLDEVLRTF